MSSALTLTNVLHLEGFHAAKVNVWVAWWWFLSWSKIFVYFLCCCIQVDEFELLQVCKNIFAD